MNKYYHKRHIDQTMSHEPNTCFKRIRSRSEEGEKAEAMFAGCFPHSHNPHFKPEGTRDGLERNLILAIGCQEPYTERTGVRGILLINLRV